MNSDKQLNRANELQHSRDIHIATASSRTSAKWKNNQMPLSDFLDKLSGHTKGIETHSEYLAMPKAKQDELKDVGGFVGGLLKGGKRNAHSVSYRDVITLDADYADRDFLETVKKVLGDINHVVYSTRKHHPAKPRYRVLVFSARPMFNDEYQAVARKLAFKMGIDLFDDSTYQPHRLMYWGSSCADVDYVFKHNDAPFLDVESLLNEYNDWQDTSQWHRSSRETKNFEKKLSTLGDPKKKGGKIGAFCRVYDIHDAIETFLSDVYKRESENRYTYTQGSSSNGLVVYDNVHAYSNHSTDPTFGQTVNAFDLVRIHKFGDLDDDAKEDLPITKKPSFVQMQTYVEDIEEVKLELVRSGIVTPTEEMIAMFDEVFDDIEDADKDADKEEWLKGLQTTDKGVVLTSFVNAVLICTSDTKINKLMAFNELSGRVEKGRTGEMWSARHSYSVRNYVGVKYNVDFPEAKIEQAIENAAHKNPFHPLKEYLENVVWDGTPRVETLFSDWLGAEDNVYTRAVAKCFMVAAISRVYQPGYKFDTVPVLAGEQGIGKSAFIEILAKKKYFVELDTYDTQKAVEKTTGKWLVEIVELAASNKHQLEEQKAFITSTSSVVRPAYGRHPIEYKRQFVLIGTTNEDEYLKDSTGNRRYLPIDCTKALDFEAFEAVVDQLWAEAFFIYQFVDTSTVLKGEAARLAKGAQDDKRVADEWEGVIREWLKTPAHKDRYEKKNLLEETCWDDNDLVVRDKVCFLEVWEDCLNMRNTEKPYDRKRIRAILNRVPYLKQTEKAIRFGKRFGVQRGWVFVE